MAADQQTVQQSAFNLCILYGRHHLHEVLGVDVTRLELHLGLYRGVPGLESLPQDFSEGLDEVYFILVDGVPAFFVVVDIENFPVIRLLSSVFLDRGHNLVDEEGYLNVGGIVDVVDQGIKGFSLVLNCSSNKFSYLFEVVASSENYLLLIFQGTSVRLKGIFYQLLGSDSFSVFNSKHLSDESLHRVRDRDVRRESDKSVIDETNQFGNGAFLVGTYSVEHFVEDDPQRPNICSDVVDESFEDLRGHVDGWTHHGLGHIVFFEELLAETKICQFHDAVVEEDVGGFEISMQDVFCVEFFKGAPELQENLEGFSFCKFSLGLDVLCKSAAVAELVDQIVVVGSSEHLNELDDVDMVDFAEDGDLVIGELAQFGCMFEFLHVHDLHCKHSLCLAVLCLVDVAVLPLTYLFKQNVILNNLVHSKL